eukprot:385468_1
MSALYVLDVVKLGQSTAGSFLNATMYSCDSISVSVPTLFLSGFVPVWLAYKEKRKAEKYSASSVATQRKLLEILRDPNTHRQFMDHMMEEFAVELLMFYDAVTEYSCLARDVSVDPQVAKFCAGDIYDNFVKEGSKTEINISSIHRARITREMA